MEAARWSKIRDLLDEALRRAPEARQGFLDEACGEDAELRGEVISLLRSHSEAGGFLDQPVAQVSARIGEEAESLATPVAVGPYRILELVGRGGMGTVYKAVRDDDFRWVVAVKMLPFGLADPELVSRFRSERQILADLEHPHIARLLDGGSTEEGSPYLVMEYVDGMAIDHYCDEHRLTVAQRLRLFEKVCDAVQFAHRNLVIHRDLKPANILVTHEGEPKLLDFGIAKILGAAPMGHTLFETTPGRMPMTPQYASPEQVRRRPLTTATDVYSLGLVLYELLAGRPPYLASLSDVAASERRICEQPVRRPSTALADRGGEDEAEAPRPEEVAALRGTDPRRLRRHLAGDLDNIVGKALRKEPERRYASPADLGADLRRHLTGRPVAARPDTLAYRAAKFVQRNRAAVAAGAAAVLVLIGFILTLWQQQKRTLRLYRESETTKEAMIELFRQADPGELRGRDLTVAEMLDRSVEVVQARMVDNPRGRADLLNDLGRVFYYQGLFAKAAPLAEEALELRRDLPGPARLETAESLHLLADIRLAQDEIEPALNLLARAVELAAEAGGEGEAILASLLKSRADAQQRAGRFAAAEASYTQALEVAEEAVERDDPLRASILDGLGMLLIETGRDQAAEETLRRSLEIARTSFGDLHPQVAGSVINLATLLKRQGRFEEAEALHRENVERLETVYDTPHVRLAAAYNNLGSLLHDLRRFEEAEVFYRKALDLRGEVLGTEHSRYSESLHNLGSLLVDEGRLEDAEPMLREALRIRRESLGEGHPEVVLVLNSLGHLQGRAGRAEEAESSYQEALEILRHQAQRDEAQEAVILNNLARLRREAGDRSAALALYDEAVALLRESTTARPLSLASALSNLATTLAEEGRVAEAETATREGLEISREALGHGHQTTQMLHYNLGLLLFRQERWGDTESVAKEMAQACEEATVQASAESTACRYNTLLLAKAREKASAAR